MNLLRIYLYYILYFIHPCFYDKFEILVILIIFFEAKMGKFNQDVYHLNLFFYQKLPFILIKNEYLKLISNIFYYNFS